MTRPERNLIAIGVITWLIVSGPTMLWQVERYGAAWQTIAIAAALAAFLLFFLLRCRRDCNRTYEIILLVLQAAAAVVATRLQVNGFAEVLLVVVAGQLGKYPFRVAIAVCVAMAVILGLVRQVPNGPTIFAALAYFALLPFANQTGDAQYREKGGPATTA